MLCGASQEGVLRNHKITWTGHVRDSAVFSITDYDWPGVKQRLEFRLPPQGVIMGQVSDEEGDPLPRSSVSAYPMDNLGSAQTAPVGMRGGGQFGQSSGGSAMANDIGEYRIAGLSPGRYLVVATSQGVGPGRGGGRGGPAAMAQSDDLTQVAVPTYYPSATDPAAAAPIEIAPGQDVAGINITIRRGALHRIQGRVMGGNPQELPSIMLSLMPRAASGARGRGRCHGRRRRTPR